LARADRRRRLSGRLPDQQRIPCEALMDSYQLFPALVSCQLRAGPGARLPGIGPAAFTELSGRSRSTLTHYEIGQPLPKRPRRSHGTPHGMGSEVVGCNGPFDNRARAGIVGKGGRLAVNGLYEVVTTLRNRSWPHALTAPFTPRRDHGPSGRF
jgi:hypothetical protein